MAVTAVLLIAIPFLPGEQRLLRTALQAALGSACLISATGLLLRARDLTQKWAGGRFGAGYLLGLSYVNREERYG
jgi:hypothetical protein